MPKNFLEYEPKHLPKVNAQRLASSLVKIQSTPLLEEGQVLFSAPASANNEPRSCINCWMWNEHPGTCYLMGPEIRAEKFTYPPKFEEGSKPIEYWPVCGMWDFGHHHEGRPIYKQSPYDDPDSIGFGYVNAPEVGLERSGTNCGGQNGGDDCDNYITKGPDKRAEDEAYCRVLGKHVPNLACCTAWGDDDWVDWQKGQDLLKDLDSKKQQGSSPNPLLGKTK